jgi:mannosyltransferase OCH1-like enzyme
MSSLLTVPKVLPVREEMAYKQKIPKIIWQTMKTNQVSVFMYDYTDTWIRLNPEYEYRLYNDDVIEFIKYEFSDYLEAYRKIEYGASKADLWRKNR